MGADEAGRMPMFASTVVVIVDARGLNHVKRRFVNYPRCCPSLLFTDSIDTGETEDLIAKLGWAYKFEIISVEIFR